MSKSKTIDSFFKKKINDVSQVDHVSAADADTSTPMQPSPKKSRIQPEEVDVGTLIRDPGKRPPIWKYDINQRDEIRRAYIKAGPYQFHMEKYPCSGKANHPRRFQFDWFKIFPNWLEYSPEKDSAFCLPCYLFNNYKGRSGSSAFTEKGFRNWKKVNNGNDCAFLNHVGKDFSSPHNVAVKACEDSMDQSRHIDKVMHRQSTQQILNNQLRLKASIDAIRWLTFQACAFRGRDESVNSRNRGNFIEMLKLLASYNKEVDGVVLENAPHNAKYISSGIQKEILYVFARNVRSVIRDEIGDAKFCIIIDEARDESKREQMAIVLRFVDKEGFIRERFIDIVHVKNTAASTLKNAISNVLSHHNLSIHNIRGQGYDGASNMRGEWNGLQALFLQDCPYAYYIHCLAHMLQLALIAASREVIPIHQFFSKLSFIVNFIGASCKRNDELHAAQEIELANLMDMDVLETGTGLNQLGTLQRPGDTRWGSHFNSVCSLKKLFGPICKVLKSMIDEGTNYSQRGDAASAYDAITSFEFVFILHSMIEIMGITDMLCQCLQQKSQDILNAMALISSTKDIIQELRESGWDKLFQSVVSFSEYHDVEIPNMDAHFIAGRSRRHQQEMTMEHHYKVDIFYAAIDSQLQELNSRFNEKTVDLLTLSCSLEPRNAYESFNIGNICTLAEKFYPDDFTEQERIQLRFQLQHYVREVRRHPDLQNLSRISDLCRALVTTKRSEVYFLVDRLIRLVLTLPVSTTTTERAFSAMNIVKTRLRNKMEDDFLADYLVVYIEKEIAEQFSSNMIIDDFNSLKERRVQLA